MTNTILIKEEVIIFTWLKHNPYVVKIIILVINMVITYIFTCKDDIPDGEDL